MRVAVSNNIWGRKEGGRERLRPICGGNHGVKGVTSERVSFSLKNHPSYRKFGEKEESGVFWESGSGEGEKKGCNNVHGLNGNWSSNLF